MTGDGPELLVHVKAPLGRVTPLALLKALWWCCSSVYTHVHFRVVCGTDGFTFTQTKTFTNPMEKTPF